jgi:transposase
VPGSGRRALPAAVRRVTEEVLPDDAARTCPDCQHALQRIGARVTEQWDWVPDSYVVRQLVRPEFACPRCKGAGVVCAELPPQPVDGSHAGAGLLAHVVVSKFLDGLPLYRQAQIAAREGVPLGRNTLSRWLAALGPAVRTLVDRVLLPAARAAPLLHTDATGLPVLAARQVRLGHAFVDLAPGDVAVFRYAPAHTTAAAREVLGPYGGVVVCDGATIDDALFEGDQATRRAGCWSHARHHLVEARPTDPTRADQALAWIGDLFALDTRTAGLPPADRTGARAAAASPVLARLSEWLARELPLVPPRSPIAKAMRYMQRQWGPLTRFVTCGSIPLTNNAAERQLRRLKLGAKNWLFVGSDLRAQDAMAWLSLLATCIVRRIEPWSYLTWLLARLPGWNQRRLDELSPWAFQQAQQPDAQVA